MLQCSFCKTVLVVKLDLSWFCIFDSVAVDGTPFGGLLFCPVPTYLLDFVTNLSVSANAMAWPSSLKTYEIHEHPILLQINPHRTVERDITPVTICGRNFPSDSVCTFNNLSVVASVTSVGCLTCLLPDIEATSSVYVTVRSMLNTNVSSPQGLAIEILAPTAVSSVSPSELSISWNGWFLVHGGFFQVLRIFVVSECMKA